MRRLAGDALDTREMARPKGKTDIASLLMQATRRRSIDANDSFNSLGGDLLSYIQVQIGLEERLGHVPEGWEDLSLAQLEKIPIIAPVKERRSEVGFDVLLRVGALCLIVAQHSSDYPLYGGTWMLLTLMGYSAARFQLATISRGRPLRLAWQMLYPIVPLYLLFLVLYNITRDTVPLAYYTFTANYILISHSLLSVYWFVSAYVQIVVLLTIATAIPLTRNAITDRPWSTAALALGAALVVEAAMVLPGHYTGADAIHYGTISYLSTHGFIECLPIFLIGWLLRRMSTTREIAVTVLFSVVEVVLFASLHPPHEAIIFLVGCIILVALSPRVRLPVFVARFVQKASAATLFVYLIHALVVFGIMKAHLPQLINIAVAVPVSFALALSGKFVFDYLERRVVRQPAG